jgi:hypothetical protein
MLPYALHVHFHLHDSWMLHGAPSVNTSIGAEIAQEWWNGLWVCPLTLRGLWRDLEKRDCDFHTSLIPFCTFLVVGWLNIITYPLVSVWQPVCFATGMLGTPIQWAMSGNWFHGVGYQNSLNANTSWLFGAISTLSSINYLVQSGTFQLQEKVMPKEKGLTWCKVSMWIKLFSIMTSLVI